MCKSFMMTPPNVNCVSFHEEASQASTVSLSSPADKTRKEENEIFNLSILSPDVTAHTLQTYANQFSN